MTFRILVTLPVVLAACARPPNLPPPNAPPPEPRLHLKLLYVLDDGGVYRYDELATAAERPNRCEVRTERDSTFTRYSFTLHEEGPQHWWTSL